METYSIFHGILNGLTNYLEIIQKMAVIIQVYNE